MLLTQTEQLYKKSHVHLLPGTWPGSTGSTDSTGNPLPIYRVMSAAAVFNLRSPN